MQNYQSKFTITNDNGTIKVNGNSYTDIQNGLSIGLTCFESICLPREIINEKELNFSENQIEKIIKEILRCSICYEIFEKPVNIKNCLHKFCKKCIENYNRKIKKECAICRHPIETKRLMKDDETIQKIIECIIPNINKFNEIETQSISKEIKGCFFKDEEKFKNQIENTKREDEIESKELIRQNELLHSNQNEHFKCNKVTNENLGKKTLRDNSSNINFNNHLLENKISSIMIKLNVDDSEEGLKKFFEKTKIKVQDSYNLDFISRYICYKQNFKCEYIKRIRFYTLEENKTKKFWNSHSTTIKTLVDYDKNIKQDNNNFSIGLSNPINNNNNNFNNYDYELALFFLITQ